MLLGRLNFLPAFLERALVERPAFQIFGVGVAPQLSGLLRVEHAAPFELIDEGQRLLPILGLLLCLELEPQSCGVLFRQRFERDQRFLEPALVEQHVGFGYDAHRRIMGCELPGTREITVTLFVMAQFVCGARREHRTECRQFVRLHCHRGGFFCTAIATLEVGAHSPSASWPSVFAATARAEFPHLRRQFQRAKNETQQQVSAGEADYSSNSNRLSDSSTRYGGHTSNT